MTMTKETYGWDKVRPFARFFNNQPTGNLKINLFIKPKKYYKI